MTTFLFSASSNYPQLQTLTAINLENIDMIQCPAESEVLRSNEPDSGFVTIQDVQITFKSGVQKAIRVEVTDENSETIQNLLAAFVNVSKPHHYKAAMGSDLSKQLADFYLTKTAKSD